MTKIQNDEEIIYRIASIKENFNGTDKIGVKLQVINSSRSFYCLVEDIYNKNWLKHLSKEDCAHLAVLYVADHRKDIDIANYSH